MGAVRTAQGDDAASIAQVHVASWRAAYAGLLPEAVLAGLSVDRCVDRWRQILSTSEPATAILVSIDPDVCGFAVLGRSRDADAAPAIGELRAIYLDPSWWGCGHGAALHDAATRALRTAGFTEATLWVVATNARAIRFYTRHGWTPDGTERHDTIGDGAAVVHEKRLRCLLMPA